MGLIVKTAAGSDDKDKAYRVRYNVFIKELGFMREKNFPDQMEKDEYDLFPTTTHFLALHDKKEIAAARLVGPYPEKKTSGKAGVFGLPMEEIFDLSDYKKKDMLPYEISRSCVLEEHRMSRVIMDIWRISIQYARQKRVCVFCSCAGTETDCSEDARVIYLLLKAMEKFHPVIFTPPVREIKINLRPRYVLYDRKLSSEILDRKELSNEDVRHYESLGIKLPSTLEYFIRIGARFTGPPHLFPAFGMYTMPMILELDKINEPFRSFFERKSEWIKL
ncbi:MAG: GNAT family N-acetyltransferase [bacterium]|nr:GNAT family N-acetyltransferase [bacterium]